MNKLKKRGFFSIEQSDEEDEENDDEDEKSFRKKMIRKANNARKDTSLQNIHKENEIERKRLVREWQEREEEKREKREREREREQQQQRQIVQGFNGNMMTTFPTFSQQSTQKSTQSESPLLTWIIDKQPVKHLSLQEPPNWTKIIDNKYEFPIWGQIQGSNQSSTRLQIDTQPRIIFDRLPPPDLMIIKLYNFINTINGIYIADTQQCTTEYIPSLQLTSAVTRANETCCGFSAPITTGILYLFDKICGIQQFIKGDTCDFAEKITKGVDITYKFKSTEYREDEYRIETIRVDKTTINKLLFKFYMFISGYAHHIQNLGWNNRCPTNKVLSEGINLVSITGPIRSGGCTTYHHFTVLVINNFAIITDTWAAGALGCRGPWVRIMYTENLQNLFEQINSTIRSPNSALLSKIFRTYFNAPDITGQYIFKEPMQIGILNGPQLESMIWRYMMQSHSVLAGSDTLQANAALVKEFHPSSSLSSIEEGEEREERVEKELTQIQYKQLFVALRSLDTPEQDNFARGIIDIYKKQTKRRQKSKRKTRRKTRRKTKKYNSNI